MSEASHPPINFNVSTFTYTLEQVVMLAEIWRLNGRMSAALVMAFEPTCGPFFMTPFNLENAELVLILLEKIERTQSGEKNVWRNDNQHDYYGSSFVINDWESAVKRALKI